MLGLVLAFAGSVQSQVTISFNLGSPPQWGPTGYAEARYYYLPDVEAYYDIQTSMFIYSNLGTWVHRSYLPTRYRNYDLYGGYKVVMTDYHGTTPYTHFKDQKRKYYKGYHGESQKTYGNRPGNYNTQGHSPYRKQNVKSGYQDNRQDNGRGSDNRNGKGNGKGKGNKR